MKSIYFCAEYTEGRGSVLNGDFDKTSLSAVYEMLTTRANTPANISVK